VGDLLAGLQLLAQDGPGRRLLRQVAAPDALNAEGVDLVPHWAANVALVVARGKTPSRLRLNSSETSRTSRRHQVNQWEGCG